MYFAIDNDWDPDFEAFPVRFEAVGLDPRPASDWVAPIVELNVLERFIAYQHMTLGHDEWVRTVRLGDPFPVFTIDGVEVRADENGLYHIGRDLRWTFEEAGRAFITVRSES